jgi:hypothetical protein
MRRDDRDEPSHPNVGARDMRRDDRDEPQRRQPLPAEPRTPQRDGDLWPGSPMRETPDGHAVDMNRTPRARRW